MTELSHTKEPWATEYRQSAGGYAQEIFDADGQVIATAAWYIVQVSPGTIATNRVENARRIVACVNACEGIPTEKLEGRTIADYVGHEAYLHGMSPTGEGMNVGLSGLACQMLAASFAGQFVGSGAVNYLEVHMEHPEIGDFNVTIQRKHGKTPGQMKAEAIQQRDQLLAALEKYEAAFDSLFVQCCSNPIWNAWGGQIDLSLLNDAHHDARVALAAVKGGAEC